MFFRFASSQYAQLDRKTFFIVEYLGNRLVVSDRLAVNGYKHVSGADISIFTRGNCAVGSNYSRFTRYYKTF